MAETVRHLIEAATLDLAQPSGQQAALYKLLRAQEQVLATTAPDRETLLLLRRTLNRLQTADEPVTAAGRHALGDAIDKLDLALARLSSSTLLDEDPWSTAQLSATAPRVLDQARVRGERLRAIHEIGVRLNALEHTPHARCAIVEQQIARAMAVERCSVAIFDPSRSLFHFVYSSGAGEDLLPPGRPLGNDPLSYALRARRVLRLNEPTSELHAPLLAFEDEILGVLSVYNQASDAYDDEDEQFLAIAASQLATAWSRVQLQRHAQRRLEEVHVLHDATVAMASDLSLEQVLETVAHHLVSALGVEGARILRRDPAHTHVMRVLLDLSRAPNLLCLEPGDEVAVQDFPTAERAVATREPALASTGDGTGDLLEAQRLKAEGVRTLLVVPLIARGEVVGVVALRESRWERSFPPGDVRLAQMLANQAAVAIENARIYSQTTQLVTELTALRETALDLASQLDYKLVLERVIERASLLLGARGGTLYLIEAGGNTLRVAISRVPWADFTGQVLRVGEGLAGRVVQTGRPMLVNDYARWPARTGRLDGVPITAAACVPLRWSGRVLGALNILDDRPERVFSSEDLDLLSQFAPQASLSIRNAQLYRELERHVQELQQAQAQLVQSEKLAAVGRLAASIAHEVNNPLQSIQNCLHLCLHLSLSDEKRHEYLSLADQEVMRLVEIVQRLLDFYRPSREGQIATQINTVLHDVLSLANKQLEHAHVHVERKLDPGLPPVEAVPNHLKQVFLNLILNATEAMPEGGTLHVSTSVEDGRWVVTTLRDTGIGIAGEDLPKIFEPFFTSKHTGSGLGLSISYGIVQAHAGEIAVESETGRGTTFLVRLPLGPMSEARDG